MRVAIVGPLIEENLAVGYLCAALRAGGHHAQAVSFVNDDDHAEVARQVLATAPDVVGLSMSFQRRAAGYVALAEDLRAFGFRGHLTAGGHFASLAAERLLSDHRAIDSIICGEGEDSLVALAAALDDGTPLSSIAGIVLRDAASGFVRGPRPTKRADLDSLPAPVRERPPRLELGIPVAPLIASRGCRGRCAYCSIAAFGRLSRGPLRRERSPEHLAAEMSALWRTRGARVFVFHDDDFFAGDPATDLERLERLGAAMTAEELPRVALSVKARPDDVAPAVFAKLRELGLVQVVLGIDNDAPSTLRSLDRCLAPHAQRDALTALGELGLSIGSNLLLWAPQAAVADLWHNLELMAAFPHQLFGIGRAEPYEGAPMTLELARRGRLLGDYLGRDYVVGDPAAELAWQLFRRSLADRCYQPDGTLQLGIRLHWWSRLHRHFAPSPRADELVADADRHATEIATSTREWLAELIDLAERRASTSPGADQLDRLAAPLAAAVRSDDTTLSARARALMVALLRAARDVEAAPPSRRARQLLPRLRHSMAAAGIFAACTCAACVVQTPADPAPQPMPAPADEPAPPAAPVAMPDAGVTAPAVPDAAPPRPVDPDRDAVRDDGKIQFRLEAVDVYTPSCGGCSYAMGIQILSYRIWLRAPEHYEFDHFTTPSGKVSDAAISPDGRNVWGVLRPGSAPGNYDLVAVFRNQRSGQRIKTTQLYQVSSADALRCEPGPCSDPVGMPHDGLSIGQPQKPPKLERIKGSGRVVFTRSRYQTGRADNGVPVLDFGVGVKGKRKRAEAPADPKDVPTISCTAGHVLAVARGDEPGLRDWFRVTFSPAPQGGGRMQGGVVECKVTYAAAGDEAKPHTGTLKLRITEDGSPTLTE